jgi:transcriptional regulator with XRE-family HTH domain
MVKAISGMKQDGVDGVGRISSGIPKEQRQRSVEIVERALTQIGGNASELARMVGVSANTASQWRRGAIPGPEYLAKVAPLAGYSLVEAQNYIYQGVRDPVDVDKLMKGVRLLSRVELARFHEQFCGYLNELLAEEG